MQEYVEAATLCKFCKTGTLLNLDEINATLLPLSDPSQEPLQINVLDYLLGVIPYSVPLYTCCWVEKSIEEEGIRHLYNVPYFGLENLSTLFL